jgi:hypothetical protein
MQFKVKSNAKAIEKRTNKRGKELSRSLKRALTITAAQAELIIKDRTAKGTGYKGGAFDPYSADYLKFRTGKGRGSIPDLEFKGDMLNAMTQKVDRKKAVIFFSGASESKKAAMNNKGRPFFGLSDKEQDRLGRTFFKALT